MKSTPNKPMSTTEQAFWMKVKTIITKVVVK